MLRRGRRIALAAAGLGVLAAGVLALWWFAGAGSTVGTGDIDVGDSRLVALGRDVYAAHCAACHGAELEGESGWRTRKPDGTLPAPPHDETGHTWHHGDALLFEITKLGGQAMGPPGYASGMPGFADILTDREIAASLAFIKSRWPDKIRRRQDKISRSSP
jgi:mono/diheme cytochrome c family protein